MCTTNTLKILLYTPRDTSELTNRKSSSNPPDDMAHSGDEDVLDDEDQLWAELHKVVSTPCDAAQHQEIDDALRAWLQLASACPSNHVALCSRFLLHGRLFLANSDYVRTQIIHSFFQFDDAPYLYPIANFLLLHGREDQSAFRCMIDDSCFKRLLELINLHTDQHPPLHQILVELMYEMSRVEPLRLQDLALVDDAFVHYLFHLVQVPWDYSDPFLKSIIQVLLVLNEQYMVASAKPPDDPDSPAAAALTNRVVKCLSLHGHQYQMFGSNLIFCINRETETAMQLLILKMLYLLFTSPATYDFCYVNDLRVLVDIILRNLWDLPKELMSLRHTYLRVLHPLLRNTRLSDPPHYKKDEIRRLMVELAGGGDAHFEEVDETTERLVKRVSQVEWLLEDGSGASEIARKFLGISLSPTDTDSSISVAKVAEVTEKAGVQTPHRKMNGEVVGEKETRTAASKVKRVPPEVPRHRHGVPYAAAAATAGSPAAPVKKQPPKAPPPRRKGRLKAVLSTAEEEREV
ncbi:hypothetical protein F5Y16DRAFT_357075 [Xylariaceae sp. FL0255]|nr:hypothetical protein F5Y16DRAFT_357075 [Xylariaceae sp. FL0255]